MTLEAALKLTFMIKDVHHYNGGVSNLNQACTVYEKGKAKSNCLYALENDCSMF